MDSGDVERPVRHIAGREATLRTFPRSRTRGQTARELLPKWFESESSRRGADAHRPSTVVSAASQRTNGRLRLQVS